MKYLIALNKENYQFTISSHHWLGIYLSIYELLVSKKQK